MPKQSIADHLDELALQHARKDFVQISVHHTVSEALAQIQSQTVEGRIVYFYVVDEANRLQGVLPIRRLLLHPPETPVARLMVRNVVSLSDTATLLDACEQFILHRFLALPIVDRQHCIVGVVDVELYTDEISDLVRQEESNDVFQLIGVRLSQVERASLPAVFRRRFPWLLCNVVGGLACAFLAGQFEGILGQVIALSLFIPVVLAIAESVSIQSLTLALQARYSTPVRGSQLVRSVVRQVPLGSLLGAGCGGLIAMVILLWQGTALLAVSVVLSVTLAGATAALLGQLVPTLLRVTRRDPKVASGPVVLAATDLAALFYYLGLATLLLR